MVDLAEQSSTPEYTSSIYLTDETCGWFYGVFLLPMLPVAAHSGLPATFLNVPTFLSPITEDHSQHVLNQKDTWASNFINIPCGHSIKDQVNPTQ